MAAVRSHTFNLEVWPKFIRDWIEGLGPLGDIIDIEVSRDCVAYISDGGFRKAIPNGYFKVKVTIPSLEHCCTFVKYNGEWTIADENADIVYPSRDENIDISYASSYETVVEKQELTDNDAFDLMDSIREEIKYGNNS